MADETAEGCCELVCGGCCIALVTAVGSWCDYKPFGLRTSNKQSGCCPSSFGGMNGEDRIDRAEREEREKHEKQQAAAEASQPTATMPMTSPIPGHPKDNDVAKPSHLE